MKKFAVLLTATILMCVSAVQSQERRMFNITVPFAFTVENASLPAGEYNIYLLNPYNLVRIQSVEGSHVAVLRCMPSQSRTQPKSEMIFNHVEGQFFLSKVVESHNEIQLDLPQGEHARELMAKGRSHHTPVQPMAIAAR